MRSVITRPTIWCACFRPSATASFVAETVPPTARSRRSSSCRTPLPATRTGRPPSIRPIPPIARTTGEVDLINRFRENGAQQELVIERDTPMGQLLHMARPLSGADGGMPDLSQRAVRRASALTRTYGTTNGFGWKLHETIGAQILTVPMAVALKAAHDAYVKALIIPGRHLCDRLYRDEPAVALRDHYAIVAPVKRLSAMAEAVSLRPEGRGELHQTRQGRDVGAVGGFQPHAGKPQAGDRDDRMTLRRQLGVQRQRGLRANILFVNDPAISLHYTGSPCARRS